jgi:hypothetical protein
MSVLEYRSRLHSLDGFEGVYNREPDRGDGLDQKIHVYVRLSERGEKQRFLSVVYQQDQQNVSKYPRNISTNKLTTFPTATQP